MLAPVAGLAGPAPTETTTAVLAPSTTRDLKERLNAPPRAHMRVRRRNLAGRRVVEAMHKRDVPLGSLSPKLRGVVARAPETVLVGGSGGRAAILGAPPVTTAATTDEVMTYVESLLRHDRIDFGDGKQRWRGYSWWSHVIRTQQEKKVLVRGRFACSGGRRRA
jgi:hypothetical protein